MKIHAPTALTLVELLVATAIIGIVLIGVVSVDYAIRQSEQTASHSTLVSMRTSMAMSRITKDAALAAGDLSNPGIYTYESALPLRRTLCVRQDVNDPNIYTDDTWICSTQGTDTDLYRCTETAPAVDPCQASNPARELLLPKIVLLDFNDPLADHYIEVTLTYRYDNSVPENPITNPEEILTTRIIPSGQSW